MSLGYGVVQLDVTIVNVRLNSIGRSYGGAVDTLQWVVSAYTITFATLILTAGALGDRIGVKVALATSASLLTVAGLAILVGLKTPKGDTGAVSRPMKSR